MAEPKPPHLMTTEEVIAAGWAGESRNQEGHVTSLTALSRDDNELSEWIFDRVEAGEKVTFFPQAG